MRFFDMQKHLTVLILALICITGQLMAQPIISSPDNSVNAITGAPSEIPKDGSRIDSWTTTSAYWASPLIYRSQRFPNDGTGSFPFNQYGELMIQGTSSGSGYNKGISFLTWDGTSSTASIRMRIADNGNVGIGTTNPYSILEISPTATSWGEGIVVNPAPNSYGAIFFRQTEGTYNGSWFVGKLSTNNFGVLRQGLTGMAGTSRAESTFEINHTNGNALFGGNVGIGTTDPKSKLAVDGDIRATRVKVLADISVPDYVFEESYELRTLQETKTFIEANKHLPEIPSAAQIGKDGIDLGDMNMRLLKKIEELTLYQIQMMEEMNKMKKELEALKN